MAPGGGGKIRVISSRPKVTPPGESKGEGGEADTGRTKKKREPVISLAKMPELKQPPAKPQQKEPAPQKPEIRLPKDAIAGHKRGTPAPWSTSPKPQRKPPSRSPAKGDWVIRNLPR